MEEKKQIKNYANFDECENDDLQSTTEGISDIEDVALKNEDEEIVVNISSTGISSDEPMKFPVKKKKDNNKKKQKYKIKEKIDSKESDEPMHVKKEKKKKIEKERRKRKKTIKRINFFVISMFLIFVINLIMLIISSIITLYFAYLVGREMNIDENDLMINRFIFPFSNFIDFGKNSVNFLIESQKEELCSTQTPNYTKIENFFELFINGYQLDHIFQLRVIGDDGLEKVRLENDNGIIYFSEYKQNKSQRDYFIDYENDKCLNEPYFSNINLNIENKTIEIPYKPTVRVYRSIICSNQKKNGFIIINMKLSDVIIDNFDLYSESNSVKIFTHDKNIIFNSEDRSIEWSKDLYPENYNETFNNIFGEFHNSTDFFIKNKHFVLNEFVYYIERIQISEKIIFFLLGTKITQYIIEGFWVFIFGFILWCSFLIIQFGIFSILFLSTTSKQKIGKQKKKIKKFNELKDFEILLKEQKVLERHGNQIKIRPEFFKIDYENITIMHSLGVGGSNSRVYLAKWNGKNIAFKCFQMGDVLKDDEVMKKFEKEAAIFASLTHPNILRFYGCSLKYLRIGIVMEFAKNGSLREYMMHYYKKKEFCFTFEKRLELIYDISSAMDFLHSKQIIHRDLKLENVLLCEKMDPKLADFGLSRVIDNFSGTKTTYIGTSYYMAPEIVRGSNEGYGEKVDLFSMGMLFFEIMYEELHPFGNKNLLYVEFRIANNPSYRPKIPEGKEDLNPKWVNELTEKLWSANYKERPSFNQIKQIIREAQSINSDDDKEKKFDKISSIMSITFINDDEENDTESNISGVDIKSNVSTDFLE